MSINAPRESHRRICPIRHTVKNNSWEEVFASAKPMRFNAFNTGRITGKVKTYSNTTSFPENIDINIDLEAICWHFASNILKKKTS